jgi:hypothetical protein
LKENNFLADSARRVTLTDYRMHAKFRKVFLRTKTGRRC